MSYFDEDPADESYFDDMPGSRCKHCGSTEVRWRQQGGKWVMFSLQPGVEHQCPARGAASPDEFD